MERDTQPLIEAKHAIAAPVDVVWDVLTGAKTAPAWLGCLSYKKARLGRVFYMQPDPAKRAARRKNGAMHCEILELSAPERFVFSWFAPGAPVTTVTIELEASAHGTEVALTHDGWDQFPPAAIAPVRDGLANSWTSHFLPALEREVEKRVSH